MGSLWLVSCNKSNSCVQHNINCIAISTPPQDTSTIFGSIAAFNCMGKGDLLQWTYDGLPIAEDEEEISIVHHNVSGGMVSSSLYINATIDNDGAAIGCRIVVYSPFDIDSAGAVLTIKRIGPVENFSLSIDDVPYVTWTIPSVIAPDIPVSDIRYTVTLEGGNITSTVNDIDDAYYQFTDITVLNCTVYTATVNAYDVTHHSYTSDSTTIEEESIVDTSTVYVHCLA